MQQFMRNPKYPTLSGFKCSGMSREGVGWGNLEDWRGLINLLYSMNQCHTAGASRRQCHSVSINDSELASVKPSLQPC